VFQKNFYYFRRSTMSEVLRTPDERFNELPDFPYAPNYLDNLEGYEGLRMHYMDEGPRDAANVFLCLHGEPTWSYLYRKMIPVFTAAGHRVVAPDYFGFGRSDKPVPDDVYQFDFHRDSLLAFIAQLDLSSLTIVCQDWGGLLGLTLPMEIPDRISRLLIMNTALGTGDVKLSEGFVAWRNYVQDTPDFDVGRLMKRSCPLLTDGEIAAYNAPFPDARYKAGVRRFPAMVPDNPQAPGAELSRRARECRAGRSAGREGDRRRAPRGAAAELGRRRGRRPRARRRGEHTRRGGGGGAPAQPRVPRQGRADQRARFPR
jgi:pimeloyl-ACP methyl ester carboxylesterase